jgi:hypothetical protein
MSDVKNGKPEGAPVPVTILEEDASDRAGAALAVRVDEPLVMDVRRSLPAAKAQFEAIQEFVKTVLKEGVDYGTVPGIDKPFLFKSGGEKLCALFGYAPQYVTLQAIEDWGDRNPLGFFFYRYRCDLVSKKSGVVMGSGIGSANSKEERFRWTQGTRKCPNCGKATIIKGREEYGGGWICWSRKESACGAKFLEKDPTITEQSVERVEREAFSQANNIDKQAQKRALVASALIATGTSSLFTQDEETVDTSDRATAAKPAKVTSEAKPAEAKGRPVVDSNRPNKYAGACLNCGGNVREGAGCAAKRPDGKGWGAVHNDGDCEETAPKDKDGRPMAASDISEAGNDAPRATQAAPKATSGASPKVAGVALDQEIALTIGKLGWPPARVQVNAKRCGAPDGDWTKADETSKKMLLGTLLDHANGATTK